jgi:hypothetical protein
LRPHAVGRLLVFFIKEGLEEADGGGLVGLA